MTFEVRDRIFETSVTAGVGTYTLDGAQPGFQAFSVIGANNECTYFATDDTFWEVGIGKYLTAPNRLTRETILASSNAGAAVNWGGQTVKLRCSVPAAGIVAKRRLSKNVAGGAGTTVLTQDEQRRDILEFSGALTGDRTVEVDATPCSWVVFNNTTGPYKLTFKVTGQTGVQLEQGREALAYCNGTDVALAAQRQSFRKNVIINGDGRINQEVNAASLGDDLYGHDQWYRLSELGSVAVSDLTDVENGTPFMMRLQQMNVTAQRMGYAQIIESKDCKHLRGKTVTFRFGRVRISASQPLRYAVLEWTGTADAVTSDVVNDWTSNDYTNGAAKFFVDANITPSGNTSHTPAAATLTDGPSLTVTLGGTFNNLIVFAWTEGTAAQNVTLDLSKAQLEAGSVATEFEQRTFQDELALCQRYYEKSYRYADAPGTVTDNGALDFKGEGTQHSSLPVTFGVDKRAAPTITTYSPITGTSGKLRNVTDAADINSSTPRISERCFVIWTVVDQGDKEPLYCHWVASARL